MKYKYLIKLIFGRANFGAIMTDVEVVQGQGEYEGLFLIMKSGDSDQEDMIVSQDHEFVPDQVLGEEETEYMIGNDLDQMIQIYNKQSVDLYQEDLLERFEKMKKNLNQEIDIDQ